MSVVYRLILLALLPAIAAIMYVDGQRYEPALIQFKTDSQKALNSFFPSQIGGLIQTGGIRAFSKENLYEYINGHAEYFISAGFVDLKIADYILTGSNATDAHVVAEIYDMGKNLHAFGVLTDEAGGDAASDAQVGMMGFITPQGLSFITGQYYVKLNVYKKDAPFLELAKSIDKNIGAKADLLSVFSKFPDLGKVVTTRFVKSGYRGVDFFNNVIERQYERGGENFHVALVADAPEAIQKLGDSILDFLKESQIEYIPIPDSKKRIYKALDPYEGDWYLVIDKEVLFALYGNLNDDILKAF